MRTIITIAFATGLMLTAAVVGFWATSLPAGSSLSSSAVDPHELSLEGEELAGSGDQGAVLILMASGERHRAEYGSSRTNSKPGLRILSPQLREV